MLQIDDLWLASYLLTQGGKLAGVRILPYNNGGLRMRAVFELKDVSEKAIEEYSSQDPPVGIHCLRTAMNQLRDRMYAELEKRNGNGAIKQMPNGNTNGQRRRGDNESGSFRHR